MAEAYTLPFYGRELKIRCLESLFKVVHLKGQELFGKREAFNGRTIGLFVLLTRGQPGHCDK